MTMRKPSRQAQINPDMAALRSYARRVKIACDELYDDPFSRAARATLLRLILEDSPQADAALARVISQNEADQ